MGSIDDSLPFSREQQQALVGHCYRNEKLFERYQALGVTWGWFGTPFSSKLWRGLEQFRSEYKRHPNPPEFQLLVDEIPEDEQTTLKLRKDLETSLALAGPIGEDLLTKQLRDWARSQALRDGINQSHLHFNAQKLDKSEEAVRNLVLTLDKVNGEVPNQLRDAEVGVTRERAERLEERSRRLSFGVSCLDESLGGIMPKDLIVVGAKTGAGKTQLVTNIALENARDGRRVKFFALEAEEWEIERRVKFQILAELYYAKPEAKYVSYLEWRMGEAEAELGPYEEAAEVKARTYLRNLQTMYRVGGEFGIKHLARRIAEVADESDLIIIDHLHYIDVEDDENRAYKEIVKTLRDLALSHGVPIVVVAHLRKESAPGDKAPLISKIEDFHGSSDITKIATSCVIIAPAYNPSFLSVGQGLSDMWATFIRPVKCRLDGSRLRYTAVAFFDPRNGAYDSAYAIGTLQGNDRQWRPVEEAKKPRWARNAVVRLAEIE